jgi:hypothetical protein
MANKTFSVPILTDSATEGNETVNLTLSSPTGGATLGSPSTAVLTIIDIPVPGSIQFSSATYSVNENGGSVTITVTRTGGSGGAVGVSYATSNGSATAGSDYTSRSGTLNWPNGDTSNKTFSVPILTDSATEGNETVNLTLSSPTGGATLGSPSTAVLNIFDNNPFLVDFDGDRKADLLWRHASTGQTAIWLMDGASYSSGSPGTVSDPNWQIKGMGDFDGDGKTDIFWQDTSTGWTSIWFMDGTAISSQETIEQVGLTWQIKGIGDFDGDGKADVLWQDTSTGWTYIWFMDGATITSGGAPAQVGDSSWQIKEVGDFDGDGKADILWLNTTSGWTYIWFMDGATITSGGAPAQVGDASWQIMN